MRNKCIVFFSDNQAVVEIINKQTSKDRSIMVLLRHFVLCTLKYNILFHAKHIAGCINRKSDALSRIQVEKFRLLAPTADPQPTPVPEGLLPNNWHITWPSFCTQPLPRDHVGLTNFPRCCWLFFTDATLYWLTRHTTNCVDSLFFFDYCELIMTSSNVH